MPRGHNTHNIPLSGLDPRYRELLLRGARERVEIPCESETQRRALRNAIQNFRVRCKKEDTADWQTLYRAKVSLPSSPPFLLVIAPRGSEFDSILSGATNHPVAPSATPLVDDPIADLPVTEDTSNG